jgi:hypothetical protein
LLLTPSRALAKTGSAALYKTYENYQQKFRDRSLPTSVRPASFPSADSTSDKKRQTVTHETSQYGSDNPKRRLAQ